MVFCYPSSFAFLFFNLFSAVLSVSSCNVFFLWLALELGSLSFIGLMASMSVSFSPISAAKYYLPNAASNLFFLGLCLVAISTGNELVGHLAVFPLLVKMGVAPFHFWVPSTVKSLHWSEVMILLGPHKLGVLHALSWGAPLSSYYIFLGVVSSFWGGLAGFNQARVNGLVGYSSVSMGGWVLAVSVVDSLVPYISWFLYSLTLMGFMVSCSSFSLFPSGVNLSLLLFCLLMAGAPGGSIFTVKWLVVSCLMDHGFFFAGFWLALSSVVSLPMYLNVIFMGLLFPSRRVQTFLRSPKWLAVILFGSFFWSPVFFSLS